MATIKPCKHLRHTLDGADPGARGACHQCGLIGRKLADGTVIVDGTLRPVCPLVSPFRGAA